MKRIMFCPHTGCEAHWGGASGRWYQRCGSYRTRRSGRVQRYRCKCCAGYFSDSSFTLDYYAKRRVSYARVLKLVCSCTGVRQMSRILGVHRQTVSNRIMRLARQAMSVQATLAVEQGLTEPVVIDGLVSYWVSQYVPNELSVMLGSHSRFIYGVQGCSKRRSGRMTEGQRRRREEIERRFRAEADGLSASVWELLDAATRMAERSGATLELFTDEHRTYTRVLRAHPGWAMLRDSGKAVHKQTNSHKSRTAANRLAAANTLDRSIRNDMAEHTRETIRFARNVSCSLERFACYQHWHNYRKPAAINEASHDRLTHAEHAGIERSSIDRELRGFYTRRRFMSHTPLWGSMRALWIRALPTPLKPAPDYLPRYLLA